MNDESKEIDAEAIAKFEHPTEYQEAEIFKLNFQKSKQCLLFRIAWNIPAHGFKNYEESAKWDKELNAQTETYRKSKKYKEHQNRLQEKRKELHEGKINPNEFRHFAFRNSLLVPLYKYKFDVDWVAIRSCKPVYWRDYIEQCLIFTTPPITFPVRPLPEPKLKWDVDNQIYDMVIENIYPNTTSKDFTDPEFTKKLKSLQKKLPGYSTSKSRFKPKFDFGMSLRDVDQKEPNLSDFEKAEKIEGDSLLEGLDRKKERKIKQKIRQTRYVTKKRLKS